MQSYWPVLLLLFHFGCAGGGAAPSGSPVVPRPNILFLLTDDQGIGDLSLQGNDSIRTPNLDRLMQQGIRFDRFYVSPVCAPTRASFLSGLYAPRTGAIYVTRRHETMTDSIVTLPEHLRAAGYRTGLYGKWHNGATFPYHPGGQGFDQFLGFTLGHFNDYFSGVLHDEEDRPVPFTGDLTEILTDSARQFMLESPEPFFCMIAYQAPHTPVQVADRYWDVVQERGLTEFNTGVYAMTESVDDHVGRLLDTLRQAGKLDNTIVVYASDNGPNGDRFRLGLRGTKGWVDEGGVRVPFVISLPGGDVRNGRTVTEPAAHIDLLPTLLDLAGLPPAAGLDGVSLVPLLSGHSLPHRFVYAFGQGMTYTGYPGSMRDHRYLYVARDSSAEELYDLDSDPGQQRDISATDKERLVALRDNYRAFAREVARPDRVAPPIQLEAGPGTIRLLAHEGEPLGGTQFSDPNGWANDYFVEVGAGGAYWPVRVAEPQRYAVTLRYGLAAGAPASVRIVVDGRALVEYEVPLAEAATLPVHDRVARKEVYPHDWAEIELGTVELPAGTYRLGLSADSGGGLWVKEVRLRRLDANAE